MKKLFIYAFAVGLAASGVYWWCRREKFRNTASGPVNEKMDFDHRLGEEEISRSSDVVEEMYQAKSENVQAVYERHTEAGEIMKDAYSNIMEDFAEGFSGEKDRNEKDKNKETVIDSEAVSVMKEADSISDELDDLLK